MILRRAIFASLVAVLEVSLYGQSVAAIAPKEGMSCYRSSMTLHMNLPMSDDSEAADIVNIVAFAPKGSVDNAGWIYTNRRGTLFIEIHKGFNASAAHIMKSAGGPTSSEIAARLEAGIVQLPDPESRGLLARLSRSGELWRCFTRPLL